MLLLSEDDGDCGGSGRHHQSGPEVRVTRDSPELTGMEPWFEFWGHVRFALEMMRLEWNQAKAYRSNS